MKQGGGNPYSVAPKDNLLFVYPPIFVEAATALSHVIPGNIGWLFYIGILCCSIVLIPWFLAKGYVHSQWVTPWMALLLFSLLPRFEGEAVLLTGNISTALYALVLASGIPGIRHNRWNMFYIAVIFAGLIKPPFLALLILPLLAGWGQLWRSILATSAVFGAYFLQRLWQPNLFNAFQRAVWTQVVINKDSGCGLFSVFLKLGKKLSFLQDRQAMICHIAVTGILIGAMILYRHHRRTSAVAKLWLPMLLILAIIANPRMQGYDAIIAVVPALYICIDSILNIKSFAYRATAIVVLLATFIPIVVASRSGGTLLLLLLSAALALYRIHIAVRTLSPAAAV